MNYSRIYDQLVQRAKNRVPEGYVERHHIVPRCMGGSDENSNLVALTPEEHFTAHVLLVKMYPDHPGLILAVNKMCRGHKGKRRNKMYGWLKRRFSEEMKRSQSGSGNSQHGLMWICNIETKQNRKVPKDSVLEEGWVKGRNKWNELQRQKLQEERRLQPRKPLVRPKGRRKYAVQTPLGRFVGIEEAAIAHGITYQCALMRLRSEKQVLWVVEGN